MTSVFKIDFGALKVFPYLLSGIGCAVAGYGIVEIVEKDIMNAVSIVIRMFLCYYQTLQQLVYDAVKYEFFGGENGG